MNLPIQQIRKKLQTTLKSHPTLIITAPTGSGKSTQIPQYILDDHTPNQNILVLQPRRLAAIMLAKRVATERSTPISNPIGYQTRFETAISSQTKITFITEGILLRRFLNNPTLNNITTIIFDEFHERNLNSDLALALAYQLQQTTRPDLKLIIMSATIQSKQISQYLNNCPIIQAQGRIYPITTTYLTKHTPNIPIWETATNQLKILLNKYPTGDILIFMPGVYEINKTIEYNQRLKSPYPLTILPLYGNLPPAQQQQVMQSSQKRKIIIATNIAETSLTIPGIRHVIDTGLARINRYNPTRGFNALNIEKISRASAEQRQGRAGRETSGTCTRLWTQLQQNNLIPQQDPEILRIDLSQTILLLAHLNYPNPTIFPWLTPPTPTAITQAQQLLIQLNAINPKNHTITTHGKQLIKFPLHPRLAKLIWEAEIHGSFPEAALIAALLSERPIILNNPQSRKIFRKNIPNTLSESIKEEQLESDFFALINAIHQAKNSNFSSQYCTNIGISSSASRQVWRTYQQITQIAKKFGLGRPPQHTDPQALLISILKAFPDRLAKRKDKSSYICNLRQNNQAQLSKETTLRHASLFIAGEIRETNQQNRPNKRLLSILSTVKPQWLQTHFPQQWQTTTKTIWLEKERKAITIQTTQCLQVTIQQKTLPQTNQQKATTLLAKKIEEGTLTLKNWNKTVKNWINRVRWLATIFPEKSLITYDQTDLQIIYQEICNNATSYKQIKNADCLTPVKFALNWQEQQFVEQMAPPFITLPNKRKMQITYTINQPPKGRATIQNLYDLDKTPKIANGRCKILLEILAPNMRTVQITDDLTNFWKIHYPKIKKELAKKYHKHQWK